MLFGYANIECPFGKGLHHIFKGTPRRHGRGNPHNFFILPGKFEDGKPKNILVFGRGTGVGYRKEITGLFIEFPRGMVGYLLFFSPFQPFPLRSDQVQQPGPCHGLQPPEFGYQEREVVPV